MDEQRKSRRAYLSVLGTLGVSGFAGCNSIKTAINKQLKKYHDRVQWTTKVGDPIDLELTDGTLYVYTNDAILALNPQSGEQVWKTTLPKNKNRVCYFAPFVVTEDRIYLSGCRGTFAYATDDGSQVWQRDELGLFKRALVVDGSLYSQTGRTLYVLDPESGSLEREHTLSDRNEDISGPAYRPADGIFYYAVGTAPERPDIVRAVNPATGDVQWNLEISSPHLQTRPVVDNGLLYLVSGESNVDRIEQNRLFAVDPDRQELAWTVQSAAAFKPPVAGENHVFVVSQGTDKGFLTAVDPQSEAVVWSHLIVKGDSYLSRPLIRQPRVTVAIEGQQIHTREIADGAEGESFQLPMMHDVRPAADTERLFVAGGTNIWAVDR